MCDIYRYALFRRAATAATACREMCHFYLRLEAPPQNFAETYFRYTAWMEEEILRIALFCLVLYTVCDLVSTLHPSQNRPEGVNPSGVLL